MDEARFGGVVEDRCRYLQELVSPNAIDTGELGASTSSRVARAIKEDWPWPGTESKHALDLIRIRYLQEHEKSIVNEDKEI